MNVEGYWEGPIHLFEFEYIEEGWINCTTGCYWHSVLGGGIYQYEDKWYRNWEFNYKPPEKVIVQEEPGDIQQEDPKVPQDPPEGGAVAKQIENVEGRKSTTPRRSSA